MPEFDFAADHKCDFWAGLFGVSASSVLHQEITSDVLLGHVQCAGVRVQALLDLRRTRERQERSAVLIFGAGAGITSGSSN